MLRRTSRRVLAALAGTAVATVATLAVGVAPAHAAPNGYLLAKGAGTAYSKWSTVNLAVVPGGDAKSYFFKVVNTAPTTEQFKLVLQSVSAGLSTTLNQGSTPVANTYYTPPIAPGGSLVFVVKAKLAAGTPQTPSGLFFELALRNPENNALLDAGYGNAYVAAPVSGTKRNDLFIKTGSQPFVGGSVTDQFITSNAIRPGNTATFVLRLKNDGTTPSAIGLSGGGNDAWCPANFAITIKQGTQNVTAAVQGGTYNTGTLAPGARKELKVQIKLVSATTCETIYLVFTASGPDGPVHQVAHTLVGV